MTITVIAHIPQLDQDGHLLDHQSWTPDIAQYMAQQQQLSLSEQHVQVLMTVRKFHQHFGYVPATRPLIKFLVKELGEHMTNAKLMQDFETGLVARTLARLAGLPKPPNCL